jgi:hypothetical protein
MATTWIMRFPDGEEVVKSADVTLSADKVLMLQPPMAASDGDSAVAEAQRLYSKGPSLDGVVLRRYRIKETLTEPQERVFGKIENVNIAVLEAADGK